MHRGKRVRNRTEIDSINSLCSINNLPPVEGLLVYKDSSGISAPSSLQSHEVGGQIISIFLGFRKSRLSKVDKCCPHPAPVFIAKKRQLRECHNACSLSQSGSSSLLPACWESCCHVPPHISFLSELARVRFPNFWKTDLNQKG